MCCSLCQRHRSLEAAHLSAFIFSATIPPSPNTTNTIPTCVYIYIYIYIYIYEERERDFDCWVFKNLKARVNLENFLFMFRNIALSNPLYYFSLFRKKKNTKHSSLPFSASCGFSNKSDKIYSLSETFFFKYQGNTHWISFLEMIKI